MKRWGLAVAILAAAGGGAALAQDDARMNVMIKFADVIAIASRCPTLTPNMATLEMLAIGYGIDITDGTADHQVLEAMVKGKKLDLIRNSDEEVCTIGVLGYGRNGMNMENLLLPK